MLPVFNSAGHFNYAKGAQIYLQDMVQLPKNLSEAEFHLFTTKGFFTVRRTDKAWAGIWSDMTIEQTLMRIIHTGPQGLSHGRSMLDSVISRFINGMPYAFDIMNQLEDC